MRQARLLHRIVPHVKKPEREPSAADARWRGYNVNPIPALVQMNNLQKRNRQAFAQDSPTAVGHSGRLDKSIDLSSGELIMQRVSSTDKEMQWFENSTHASFSMRMGASGRDDGEIYGTSIER